MDQNFEYLQFPKMVYAMNNDGTSSVHGREISDEAGSSNYEAMESNCSPALLNTVVLDLVFGLLAVEDIKTCRFVCQRWNAVAEPVLRKRSIITLTPGGNNSLSELKMVFRNKLPVENLKLRNSSHIERPLLWSFSKLEKVFNCLENKIKILDLDIIFKDRRPIIYELRPETQCNLSTLILNCPGNQRHEMRFSLDHLKNIKVIRLHYNVMLDIGAAGLKIAPREIHLKYVTFYSNGRVVKEVLLNNLIDFRKAKTINICSFTHPRAQKLSLDMQESINVHSLDLEAVKILGGSEAKWIIDECLFLRHIPWTQENQMKFTNLFFTNGPIDVSKLPSTVEGLALTPLLSDDRNELHLYASGPTNLDNLKYLSLDEGKNLIDQSYLHLFKDCMQLTSIYLKTMPQRPARLPTIDVAALPMNLQKLELEKPYCVVGEGFHRVPMLILNNWPLNKKMLAEMRKFGPKRIVIDSRFWGLVTETHFYKCMRMIELFQRRNKIDFWFGRVRCPDLGAEYYHKDHLGEHSGNRDPVSISEQEFQDIRQLCNSDSPLLTPRETCRLPFRKLFMLEH